MRIVWVALFTSDRRLRAEHVSNTDLSGACRGTRSHTRDVIMNNFTLPRIRVVSVPER